jgi:hypothetical protein
MTICNDCAENKGLVMKTDIRSCYRGECPYCRNEDWLTDEIHDWKYPGQQPVSLEQLFLNQAKIS